MSTPSLGLKMTNRFTSKNMPKKYKFLGEDIEIYKLSVAQVLKIQALSKELEKSETKDEDGLKFLVLVLQMGVPEFKDYSEEDLFSLPMDELSKLSNAIMEYSGLNQDKK